MYGTWPSQTEGSLCHQLVRTGALLDWDEYCIYTAALGCMGAWTNVDSGIGGYWVSNVTLNLKQIRILLTISPTVNIYSSVGKGTAIYGV